MADNQNPYAAPESQNDSESSQPQPHIWVEGEFLIVSDGATLPPRCVFTNEPVNEPLLTQTLKWAPSFRPVITERKIRVTFAVNSRRQKRQRLKRHITSGLQALAAVLLYKVTGILFASILIMGAGIMIFLENPPFLPVRKCRNDRFWLKGCGPEFLASCRDEFGTRHEPVT